MIDLGELFPRALSRETGIKSIIPDVIATRSMKINPWIRHPRAAATVTKTDSDYQFLTNGRIRKPELSEIAILTGFPDGFKWGGDAWARIGNSVPPLLMKAIALQIKSVLFNGEPLKPYSKGTKYLDILEAAWQDHLAPRQPDAPTVISTFAGGGAVQAWAIRWRDTGNCWRWNGTTMP